MKSIIYAKDVAVKPKKKYINIRKTDEWNFISLCGVMLVIHMEQFFRLQSKHNTLTK